MFATSFWRRFALAFVCLLLLVLSLPLTISPHTAFAQSSTVLVDPNQGLAGTPVTGTGANWAGGDQIQVSWGDDGSVLVNTRVQSNGTFTASFEIPTNAGQGGHDIYFTDLTGGYFVPTVFTVTSSPPPTIDLQTLDIHPLQPTLAGTSPTLRADIRNNGSAASGNFNIRWIADGKNFDGGHYSIPAGVVDTHDHIWNTITAGKHTLTFIANFDHGVPETNYNNNQITITFEVAPLTPRHKLFVIVQGFTTSLTSSDVKGNNGYGSQKDFFGNGRIESYLHGQDSDAKFMMYSYAGFTGDGKPKQYTCALTTNNDIADDAVGLYSQILAYIRMHKNVDIYIVSHSLGGVVTFAFLSQMVENGNNLLSSFPNGGALKGVFLLDSPIGGVTSNWIYTFAAKVVVFTNSSCKGANSGTLPVVQQLNSLFSSATLPNFQGATASVDRKITFLNSNINQVVATDAMANGLTVSTFSNDNDELWRPKICSKVLPEFTSTQSLREVKAGRNSKKGAVYSRSFTSGKLDCGSIQSTGGNHFDVLKRQDVQKAIWQVVTGNAPSTLSKVI